MLADILAGLLDGQMDGAAYGFLLVAQAAEVGVCGRAPGMVLLAQAPDAAQEALGAFNAGVGPFQAHVRR